MGQLAELKTPRAGPALLLSTQLVMVSAVARVPTAVMHTRRVLVVALSAVTLLVLGVW